MAIVGTDSVFAIGKQASKGTEAASPVYVDAIAPDFNVNNNVRTRRPHIGQSPFARSAYKVGVGVPISASFEATPGIIAKLLELSLGKAESGAWYTLELDGAGGTLTVTDGTNTADIDLDAADLPSEIESSLEASAIVDGGADPAEYVIVNTYDSNNYNIGFINLDSGTLDVTVDGTSAHTGTVTVTEISGGAHHIKLDVSDKYALPWFTAWRGVGQTIEERALDGKVAGLTLGFTGADAVMAELTGAALQPNKVGAGTYSMPTESYDTLPIFTVMDGAHATLDVEGTEYGTRASNLFQVLSAGFQMGNELTPIDERYAIGSKFPIGLDVTRRAVTVQMAAEIDDAALYNQITYEGEDWQDKVMEGEFRVAATTAVDESSGETPHVVEMIANKVFWSGMAIPVRPRQLVRAQLSATVLSMDSNTTSEFEFYVFNEDTTL